MTEAQSDIEVLIVGAGFGGCYLLHELRSHGFSVALWEAGKSLGGVWNWNRYPGARVDVEMPFYSFSDPDIWSTFKYTQRYPDHNMLRDYFHHVDSVWDLSKDCSFETRVVDAQNLPDGRWLVKSANGKTCTCKYFIAATGTSFKQYVPDWDGMDRFQGVIHHSSLWPEDEPSLEGKKVAVIGAGSTGVQIVQEAAKVSSQVTQFIRSPPVTLPLRQRTITDSERNAHMPSVPLLFQAARKNRAGMVCIGHDKKTTDVTAEEREKYWEKQWEIGSFYFNLNNYVDIAVDEDANRVAYDFWAKKTRARMTDPVKRDLLAPLDPPYYFGTKRSPLERDYYEMADQSNVTITNDPIVGFEEKGIRTKSGALHEFDLVAICTGYDAVTGGLATMGIRGKDGIDLHEKWQDGVTTHLGLMANGFPNMFMVYGPQAPTSLTNGPVFIEQQGEWIRDVLNAMRAEQISSLEPKKVAEQSWRDHCLDLSDQTLVSKVNTWYNGSNVPGKRREFLIYVGGLPLYEENIRKAIDGWQDFDVVRST